MYLTNIKDEGDIVYADTYLNGDSDELCELWDSDAPQQEEFHYALYEVRVTLIIDKKTGKSQIYAVDGKKLED